MPRRIPPLTEEKIIAMQPQEKPSRIFDGSGLYLEIMPSGSKLWRMKIRINNKNTLMSLGKYPEVSLTQARQKREDIRRMKAAGLNPVEERKVQKNAEKKFQAVEKEKEFVKNEIEKLFNMSFSELLKEKISVKTLAGVLVSLSDEDILKAKKIIEQFKK